MNTKHTPGPWHVGMRQAERIVYDKTGWAVANATVYHGESDRDQVLANARLIAAAPELVDACITALSVLDVVDGRHGGHAAIAAQRIRSLLQKIDS
jgi:hypothetical protein